jgi:cysteine desulfurase / selenocysteine lyase
MRPIRPFDLSIARDETPGCAHVLHFNNAGAGLMPKPVLDRMLAHLQLEATLGGYEAAELSDQAVEQVYSLAAELIGAHPQEIAIVENATRAWDMAFYAIPFSPGDRILTANAEYGSNYIAFLQRAKACGVSVEAIPNDVYGQISTHELENRIDQRVKLIAMTHVPTNGGLVNPAAEVGRIARHAGIVYLLDACQSMGQIPIDVNEIGCDILSTTGRKYLRGPRGVGFLYVSQNCIEQLEPPFLDLHAAQWIAPDRYEIRTDARRFENWERSYAALLGLGAALDYALDWGMDCIWDRIQQLSQKLRLRLSQLPGVEIHDLGLTRCGIVSFTLQGKTPDEIKTTLRHNQINVSTSSVFSTRLDMEQRQIPGLVRASIHYYNSEDEIERFCQKLSSLD